MKKVIALLLTLVMVLGLAACAGNGSSSTSEPESSTSAPESSTSEPETSTSAPESSTDETTVMTYAEYVAAAIDDQVVIEAYVQATQSWWFDDDAGYGKITVYTQDNDGAYFIYEMKCDEADAPKLTAGTKIKVTGYKAEWSGEIEITDATFEIIEADPFVAQPVDLTEKLGTDELISYQNQLASFKGLTVKAIAYKDSEWDPDIYLTVTYGENDYDFCVENYLCGPDTDVYKAVAALQAGDTIDVEGFLYWYEGVNTHITAVTKLVADEK